jgi:hypothetical protein
MKIKLITLFVISAGISCSCTMEKRLYSSGYHIEWISKNNGRKAESSKNKELNEVDSDARKSLLEREQYAVLEIDVSDNSELETTTNNPDLNSNFLSDYGSQSPVNSFQKPYSEFKENAVQVQMHLHSKRKVAMERHTNTTSPRVEGLGLAGFIIGLVGWFVPIFGFVMCLLAIIFGAVSIGKINRNPERFKGMGFAITSLVLGVVGVGIVLLFVLL